MTKLVTNVCGAWLEGHNACVKVDHVEREPWVAFTSRPDRQLIYRICKPFYETFKHQAVYLHNLGLPDNSICDRFAKRDGVRVYYF